MKGTHNNSTSSQPHDINQVIHRKHRYSKLSEWMKCNPLHCASCLYHSITGSIYQHHSHIDRAWWKVRSVTATHHTHTTSIKSFIENIKTHTYHKEWNATPSIVHHVCNIPTPDRDTNTTDTRNQRDERYSQVQHVLPSTRHRSSHSSKTLILTVIIMNEIHHPLNCTSCL